MTGLQKTAKKKAKTLRKYNEAGPLNQLMQPLPWRIGQT